MIVVGGCYLLVREDFNPKAEGCSSRYLVVICYWPTYLSSDQIPAKAPGS
jgi:hypothetical protein